MYDRTVTPFDLALYGLRFPRRNDSYPNTDFFFKKNKHKLKTKQIFPRHNNRDYFFNGITYL